MNRLSLVSILVLAAASLAIGACSSKGPAVPGAALTLLNVSYDPTRELYAELNRLFSADWKAKTGQEVTIKQSHYGSGK